MNKGFNEEMLEAALTEAETFAEAVAALGITAESAAAKVAETAAEAADTAEAAAAESAEAAVAESVPDATPIEPETVPDATPIEPEIVPDATPIEPEIVPDATPIEPETVPDATPIEPEIVPEDLPETDPQPAVGSRMEQKKKKKKPLSGIRLVLVILCLCVACVSGWKLVGIMKEYKQGNDTYKEVEDVAFKPSSHTEQGGEDEKSLIPNIDFTALKGISKNAVGWLYSPGTVINYPVAKTDNNSYYIDHLIDGTYNANGCFFVDYRNKDYFADENTIIYGHRMKNGKMLSSITNYNKQSYYDEHPVMYLLTPEGTYELQIFSAYVTQATSDAYKRTFKTKEQFQSWLDDAVRHSYVKTEVKVTTDDHIVTLSTCVKADDTRRFIALGKLVLIED